MYTDAFEPASLPSDTHPNQMQTNDVLQPKRKASSSPTRMGRAPQEGNVHV